MPRRLGRISLLAALALVAGLLLGAPATATYPGPNGRIVFDDFNTGQLYSVNPDGTSLRQLTDLPEGSFAFQPDWAPDGRRIAFASNLGGDFRLYTINRDGSDRRLVFDDQPGYGDVFPGYTPDGRRLVFQRCLPDDGVCAIYTVRLDGGGLRALTQFTPGANEHNDFWPTVALTAASPSAASAPGGSPPRCMSWAPPGPAPIRSPRRRSWPSRGNGRPTAASC
jgi:dipeptidyl aminopeptidase/acylaminoacyl peptidase